MVFSPTLRAWTPWVMAGAIAGAMLARPASAHVLQLVFGTVSLSLALRLWLQRPARQGGEAERLCEALGYTRWGEVPEYARSRDGTLHTTVFFYQRLAERG